MLEVVATDRISVALLVITAKFMFSMIKMMFLAELQHLVWSKLSADPVS